MSIGIYEANSELITAWQWQEPGLRNITDTILSIVGDCRGRALDVGCGTGRVALSLASRGLRVDAVDIEPRVIEIAKEISDALGIRCNFITGDFRSKGVVREGAYDLVVCSEVIEHVQDYQSVINNIYDALNIGGVLILSTPFDPSQFSILDKEAGHLRRFTLDEVLKALELFNVDDHFTTGFPVYRFVRYSYPKLLRLFRRSYSREALWSSANTRKAAKVVYRLIKVDNLFNRLHLGDCIIVKASKL